MSEFKNKVVLITGAAKGIGLATKEAFEKQGAIVEVIDIVEPASFIGDLAKKEDLENFYHYIKNKYSHIDVLVNNAKPNFIGIDTCSYEEFVHALNVGVTAPFYLAKLFKDMFSKDGVIINISSTRDSMSQAQSESYSAAKGGIRALTHSLARSLQHKVRVNSISPGWIDTTNSEFSQEDNAQHSSNRVGKPEDIANLILFLSSSKASFINAENIIVDGGMTKSMIYHGEDGWNLSLD